MCMGVSASSPHTYTARLGVGVADFWVDGANMKGKGK